MLSLTAIGLIQGRPDHARQGSQRPSGSGRGRRQRRSEGIATGQIGTSSTIASCEVAADGARPLACDCCIGSDVAQNNLEQELMAVSQGARMPIRPESRSPQAAATAAAMDDLVTPSEYVGKSLHPRSSARALRSALRRGCA
jgi:hypothetical protein